MWLARHRKAAVAVCAAGLGACAAFTGGDTAAVDDGGPDASSVDDGSTNDALANDGDVGRADAFSLDAGAPEGSTYCSFLGVGTLFCADFDRSSDPTSGFTSSVTASGGSFKLVPTFEGGSAPNALRATAMVGNSTAQLIGSAIPIAVDAGTGIEVDMDFNLKGLPDSAAGVVLASLSFAPGNNNVVAVSIDKSGAANCAAFGVPGPFNPAVGPGNHSLALLVKQVSNGTKLVTSVSCRIDGTQTGATPSGVLYPSMDVATGAATVGGDLNTIFSIDVDNVRIYEM